MRSILSMRSTTMICEILDSVHVTVIYRKYTLFQWFIHRERAPFLLQPRLDCVFSPVNRDKFNPWLKRLNVIGLQIPLKNISISVIFESLQYLCLQNSDQYVLSCLYPLLISSFCSL